MSPECKGSRPAGRAADGGGLGQLPGAERSPAGAAPPRAESAPPDPTGGLRPSSPGCGRPRPLRDLPVLRPHSHLRQELQGKVMEAAAALDASRDGPER